MLLLELFSGTNSVGKVAKKMGFEVISVDNCKDFNPTLCIDMLKLDYKKLPIPDFIWASPPCTSFSRLVNCHKNPSRDIKTLKPLTETGILGDKLLLKTLEIISYFWKKNPKLKWGFENPLGMMRRMPILKNIPYTTTTYCKYGFPYMKPTDIWNNFDLKLRRVCSKNHKCNILKKYDKHNLATNEDKYTLYRIPKKLVKDILSQI